MSRNRNERFHIELTKEALVFSAAHFITYDGDVCERLHGHNYRVRVDLWSALDENHYVYDFIAVRDGLAEITKSLDHHVLLAIRHRTIKVTVERDQVTAEHGDRRWSFPAGDCVLLEIENTTAELLARWIGGRLLKTLADSGRPKPDKIAVHVEENFGQWGVWEFDLD